MATFMPITNNNKKKVMLKKVLYINYQVKFQDKQIKTLFNSGSKINIISLAITRKLSLKIHKTNVEAQKIDNFTLEIFEMVITYF